jgi:hypothetical protein
MDIIIIIYASVACAIIKREIFPWAVVLKFKMFIKFARHVRTIHITF